MQAHRLGLESHKSLPALLFLEKATARTIRSHLAELQAFKVFPEIGGYDLAAVFENEPGKTVFRADIDGLPVEEKTGLPYTSKARMLDTNGIEKPVMHACGHDMHITSLLAVAETLVRAKEE